MTARSKRFMVDWGRSRCARSLSLSLTHYWEGSNEWVSAPNRSVLYHENAHSPGRMTMIQHFALAIFSIPTQWRNSKRSRAQLAGAKIKARVCVCCSWLEPAFVDYGHAADPVPVTHAETRPPQLSVDTQRLLSSHSLSGLRHRATGRQSWPVPPPQKGTGRATGTADCQRQFSRPYAVFWQESAGSPVHHCVRYVLWAEALYVVFACCHSYPLAAGKVAAKVVSTHSFPFIIYIVNGRWAQIGLYIHIYT